MTADLYRVRETYVRLRAVQRQLNSQLVKTITKSGLAQSARDLEVWSGKGIEVELEDHLAVVVDYAIYEHRFRNKNAVERFVERADVQPVGDVAKVLDVMLRARFTLIEVERIVPDVGAHVLDHVYDKRFLLADVGLAGSAQRGTLLATRLLPFRSFTMTTGAALPFDPDLAALFTGAVGRDAGLSALRLIPHGERRHVARSLVGLAMEKPAMVKVEWKRTVAREGR